MPDESPRRLGIAKRVSLEGVAEGWTDACYALINPSDYLDSIQIKKQQIDETDEDKAVEFMIDFIKQHFVSGKIMVYNDNDELELADMVAEDAGASIQITDRLFTSITGVANDPKDSSTVTETQSVPVSTEDPSISTNL